MSQKLNHPIYVARGNEQPLLEDLLASDPPAGGLESYIADLAGSGSPLLTAANVAKGAEDQAAITEQLDLIGADLGCSRQIGESNQAYARHLLHILANGEQQRVRRRRQQR